MRRTRRRADHEQRATLGLDDAQETGLPARYAGLLPERARRVVVVLADARTGTEILPYLTHRPADTVIVISPEVAPEWELDERDVQHRAAANILEVNWQLRFVGPVDVMIDLAHASAADHDATWRKLFFHLRPNGLYLLRRGAVSDGTVPGSFLAVAPWVGAPAKAQSGRSASDRELALATSTVTVGADHVAAVKRNKHVLKVREADAGRILPSREPALGLEVLRSMPAGTLDVRANVVSHEASVQITGLPEAMEYPVLHLRRYTGRIAMASNALLHHRFSALPDSFRHHRANLSNPRLVDANGDFARVPANLRPTKELTGTYYHLDSENSGHYGHLMTEVISRAWGWPAAKEAIPDLKALFRIRFANERRPELELRVFEALGISREDVVWVDEPVWLEDVVAATPMWHNQFPYYVHPDLAGTWSRLRENLRRPLSTPPSRKIFVSRRDDTGNRSCRNTREVEAFFADHGFDVLYPELFDLGEQAAIFADAEVVAGFGGSAVFNILFSTKLRTLILLNHEAYTARNEHLYTALLGGDVHYFWSSPDVSHPEGGWSEEAYYSGWEFDFARNRAGLETVLATVAEGSS